MSIVIDANMKLFADRVGITSSRMIRDYGLSSVDEIIEKEYFQLGAEQILGCDAVNSSVPKKEKRNNGVKKINVVAGNQVTALKIALFPIRIKDLGAHENKRGNSPRHLNEVVYEVTSFFLFHWLFVFQVRFQVQLHAP